jgi:hypothetical protein
VPFLILKLNFFQKIINYALYNLAN